MVVKIVISNSIAGVPPQRVFRYAGMYVSCSGVLDSRPFETFAIHGVLLVNYVKEQHLRYKFDFGTPRRYQLDTSISESS
jgi:hypothetical protein